MKRPKPQPKVNRRYVDIHAWVDPETRDKIVAIADAKNVTPTWLVREWLRERVKDAAA
jgi:hypothetical protein